MLLLCLRFDVVVFVVAGLLMTLGANVEFAFCRLAFIHFCCYSRRRMRDSQHKDSESERVGGKGNLSAICIGLCRVLGVRVRWRRNNHNNNLCLRLVINCKISQHMRGKGTTIRI